jgi:hypothetical protein
MSGLTGYGLGGDIDQGASWLAVIIRLRTMEPAGDDVASLKEWHDQAANEAIPDQFVPTLHSTTPTLATAAWAALAATGGIGLLSPADAVLP